MLRGSSLMEYSTQAALRDRATGSKLNIMNSNHASVMELPVDPAGVVWTLQGVSGHQIALEGLCRDVPITIGGIEVTHNFFITQDCLNGKDVILGQPWLFRHSTRKN